MTDLLDLLTRTYAVVRVPMTHLDDSDLELPTPCAQWSVAALVEHTIGAIDMFALAAAGATGASVDRAVPEGGALERFDTAVQRNLAAWQSLVDPAATLTLPFADLPAGLVLGMNQLDSLVHAWDLGSAMGLRISLPDDLCIGAMPTARVRVPAGRGHVFGAEVATTGQSPGEKLLAFTGRDPAGWPLESAVRGIA